MAVLGDVGVRRPRLSRGQMIALVAVLAGGIALGYYGFQTAFGNGSTTSAPIQTITVQPQTLQQTATTSGSVVSQHTSKVTFSTAGRIATINVAPSQSVQKDDVIASLDITTLKIAYDQATSSLNSAQAKLDALLAGQTPDVIAAAQAAVTQAQSSVTAAAGDVSTAQTNKQTAQGSAATAANGITTAQNAVSTAQNAITTAHSGVINAQNQLTQAQNALQNLLDGPTPQDVAVSQAAVDSARTSLQTAQENYDRLVSHADIATRPETTALITASSAYQSALAGLANAEPQPSNPLDVANQELSIQAAQQQLGIAQVNANNAQQAFNTAVSNLAAVPPPTPPIGATAHDCVVLTGAPVCIGESYTIPPSPGATSASQAALAAAQDAVTQAQNQMNTTASALVSANTTYQTALNNLQKLLNPYSTTDLSGLQGQVDASRQQLDVARRNFDNYLNLPDLAIRPETTALNTARGGYNAALANYNLKVAPPRDTDVSNARAAVTNAQAAVDSAMAAERNAVTAVNSAQVGVSNAQQAANSAQATANNSGTAITSAQGQVESAKASANSAQAKLDQLLAGPLDTDIRQAVEAVNQAKLAQQKAQNDLDGAVIHAPFAGIVAAVTANPGDQATSGTAIVTLVDPVHVEIDAQVDETTYSSLKVGMPVTVRLDAVPNPLTGVISQIVPSGSVTQGVVTFPIVITITSPGSLPPNQASASQISVVLNAKQNALAVPSQYLYRDPVTNQQEVDVIRDGKRIPTVVVTTGGLTTTTMTEIVSGGLKAGDQIARPLKKTASKSASTFSGGGLVGGGGGPVVVGPGR